MRRDEIARAYHASIRDSPRTLACPPDGLPRTSGKSVTRHRLGAVRQPAVGTAGREKGQTTVATELLAPPAAQSTPGIGRVVSPAKSDGRTIADLHRRNKNAPILDSNGLSDRGNALGCSTSNTKPGSRRSRIAGSGAAASVPGTASTPADRGYPFTEPASKPRTK
jgi:hypothetical protein